MFSTAIRARSFGGHTRYPTEVSGVSRLATPSEIKRKTRRSNGIRVLNQSPGRHDWLGFADARREVRAGLAEWRDGGMAILLVREPPLGVDAGTLPIATQRQLAGVPVCNSGRMLGMGKRSAGPLHALDGYGPRLP